MAAFGLTVGLVYASLVLSGSAAYRAARPLSRYVSATARPFKGLLRGAQSVTVDQDLTPLMLAARDQELDKVKQELLSMNKPWGDDDIGQLIEVAYEEVVDFAFECLKDVLDELCASGQDLINQATQWDEKEKNILDDFQQFFNALGSR